MSQQLRHPSWLAIPLAEMSPLAVPLLQLIEMSLPLVATCLPWPRILRLLDQVECNSPLKIFWFNFLPLRPLGITLVGIAAKGMEIIVEVGSAKSIAPERGKKESICDAVVRKQ